MSWTLSRFDCGFLSQDRTPPMSLLAYRPANFDSSKHRASSLHFTIIITSIMASIKILGSLALLGVSACAYQIPHVQEPLYDSVAKNIVDSEAFQAKISGKNLLARAEDLYKLAELSIHDWNRPTRVIGSAGHAATLEYIYATIQKLGSYYNISEQTFPAYSGSTLR